MAVPQQQLKLTIIAEPAPGSRTVFSPFDATPIYKGRDRLAPDYVCGKCGNVFMTGVSTHMLDNVVIKCPRCGAYNDGTASGI
jgi:ribosomal protein S27AE